MEWLHDLAYFFGGGFLANAIPHYVSASMGRPFQSPFAKPSGKGLSSSTVNALWGSLNLVFSWLLTARVGHFDIRSVEDAAFYGLGILLIGLMSARVFGEFHGGNIPTKS